MQAKPRIGRLLVVVFIVSLLLGACGGGTTGSTWFNLPSIKLDMRENGTANVYGINVNSVILAASVIDQLQAADIQRVEIRTGYNGIHVYMNGQDLPYVAWDAEKTDNLQDVVAALPPSMLGGQNPQQIARYLPWLRKIGLGLRLEIPLTSGTVPLEMARWSGETAITPETAETVIGPITIASLVFDENGDAYIEGMPVSRIGELAGTSIPLTLDDNTVALLQSIGVESVRISTQANGIDIFVNEEPMPGLAYDSASLERTLAYANGFIPDPALAEQLGQLLPVLQGTDLNVVVSFTGAPVAETDLGGLDLTADETGALSLTSGVSLPSASLPADIMSKLQEANVQHLSVNMLDDGLAIAANGQVLPTLSFEDESMNTLAGLVGPMAGVEPELITEGLDIVKGIGADVQLRLPVAEGAEPYVATEELDTSMTPADIGNLTPPTVRLSAKYGNNGFTELAGLSADMLDTLGVSLPTLPPDLLSTLESANISLVGIQMENGVMLLLLDGNTALTVNFDEESLDAALELATPFLGADSPIANPNLKQLLREQILPILPAADVDVSLELE